MKYETRVERRSSERFRTHLKGQIVSDNSSSPVECTVRNLSADGAGIACAYAAEIPLEFELQIPEERASARVRLIWSNGIEHGVMFTDKLLRSS
ncbi:PilZ domain-containing protein [Microvirga brassicacearum]|uniref:PilZ domain-containing protein n=1 Tax=Microvirga brassicacearum TaxID=2580413 RepID=A0A5N3P8Z8_9HYPH|nr:PilZ domain-containing protein [Microvirga brassicacearum]KAB0266210.1 PilZ domain-containing protein [Microvirga brassicacearum]